MELLQLRYFLVAAKYQHMTKAAEALQIAQPALSQSIKRLENELGVTLFDREKRNIRLNDTGRFLEKQLIPILASLEELPAALQERASQSVHTIHLNLLAASRLVTDCIIEYKQLHPDVNFRLWQNPDVENEDLCISTAFPGEELKGNGSIILKEAFFMAVPSCSSYAGRPSIRLEELQGEGFISLSNNRPMRRICDRFCLESGFTPHIICESDNPESVRNLIAAGLGIGFWPEYSWGLLSTPKVALLPIEYPVCKRDIILTRRSTEENEKVLEDFCRFLSEYAKREDVKQSSHS
ncbi:LysR family transcriptional regulator [[Clostridium] symbiosum]|uniref:LysR family transcriptional regulator n=1 Tax=Clostridium symbiosum TaxID=1512 RepID=UPI001D077A6F|nr:LysR family transcriptional regulator [[Clostridium] symbiosum]MCB6610757.1 LysR family transcriptional regulator [[Clostridium] symbiosum]MCB6931764.1 LysR family transcriptional regulator [[Clostridium] symbiosum]